MPVPATIKIEAKAGKETVEGNIKLEVDAYAAVVEESICASEKGHEIELLMGHKDRVDFLLIRADVYERPMANGCSSDRNGDQSFQQRYIEYAILGGENEKAEKKFQLKHAHLFAGDLSKDKLPNRLDKVIIDNNLTVDIKVSILAARSKDRDCDASRWQNVPNVMAAGCS